MCGIFKAPKPKPLPAQPTKDEAAEKARDDSLERRKKIAAGGKGSTVLAGGEAAQEKLKKKLGA